ncbi:hypothetical protein Ppa06_62150 [Planomonospora parontospora subsp. parontospora]|uniref:Uncharacterized protein n=2 Tax=Planomonospora parontospora TaxID=58119 RepID=A0AA37BMJ8_9ACTN|nr:hypothetical protein [Planomonospora parontospora]GGK93889.1 hypothetical protein GCM10010126_61620 [Planomonospora parontospora]GII12417.1 hypothetical protein Ppa06_62150 [Planomonospora parontospora subsp. parontospora]
MPPAAATRHDVLPGPRDGGVSGHAPLTHGTPGGGRTLTAALNHVDDAAPSMEAAFQQATQRLVSEVFGG